MLNEGLLYKADDIMTWMRDRLLRELMSDAGAGRLNLKENLSRLNINPYYTYPTVALIEPTAAFQDEHDRIGYVEHMRDYLQQYIPDNCVVFIDEESRVGLLFSWVSKESIERLRADLLEHFAQPVNIGVGKPCSYLNDVRHSYQQAIRSLQNKFYRGTGQIIYYSELRLYESLSEYPGDKEKELFEAFKAAVSESELEEAVNIFYKWVLRDGPIDIHHIYELTLRLLVGTEKRVLAEASNVNINHRYEIMSILKMDTLEEIIRYVSSFIIDLWKVVSPHQKESHRSIIKKTMYYMELECQHASLQSVAQKVYMTPTYLSLLFKNNTGKTFIEHLTDIRIDKAKDMLRSTHYKNYEVAEKVGYQDPRYFSQIFKKRVGQSPSEYRESLGK